MIVASPFMEEIYRRNPSVRVLNPAQESVLRITMEVELPTLQECATAEEFQSRMVEFITDWASHSDEMDDGSVHNDFDEVIRFVSDYKDDLYAPLMALTWEEVKVSLRHQIRDSP